MTSSAIPGVWFQGISRHLVPLGSAWGLWALPVCGSLWMCPLCVNQEFSGKDDMILLPILFTSRAISSGVRGGVVWGAGKTTLYWIKSGYNEHQGHLWKRKRKSEMCTNGKAHVDTNCCCWVAKLYLTLCDPMDCSPPGSSVHGISQARILEWVAISFSRGSSQSRDRTHISCIGRQILYHWATQESWY